MNHLERFPMIFQILFQFSCQFCFFLLIRFQILFLASHYSSLSTNLSFTYLKYFQKVLPSWEFFLQPFHQNGVGVVFNPLILAVENPTLHSAKWATLAWSFFFLNLKRSFTQSIFVIFHGTGFGTITSSLLMHI